MDNKISIDTKAELVQVLGIQYRKSSKMKKTRILDQFIAVSGYHRKHAIRLLKCETGSNANQSNSSIMRRSRRIYDEAVKEALIVLWEAADRICGKRLKAIVPSLVDAMERHGHLNLNLDVENNCLKSVPQRLIDYYVRFITPLNRKEAGAGLKRLASKFRFVRSRTGIAPIQATWRSISSFTQEGLW